MSDLCCIYTLGVSKSHLLYGVHAVCMLYVCMWVFVLYTSCVVCMLRCCLMYNAVWCTRVYGLCGCVHTVGCVYLACVYYLHIVCIVCALSYEPRALYVCAVAES